MDMKETIEYCISSSVNIAADYNISLDFSDVSVQGVSEILDSFHERFLHPELDEGLMKNKANAFAYMFGVYVGEVLIRNHNTGYVWADTKFGVALAKDENNIINPIAKAQKQIVNGREAGDDVKSFFDVAITIMQGKFRR